MALMDTVEPEILRQKYPAKEHARNVAKWIIQNGGNKNGLIYLEAQKLRYNEVCRLSLNIAADS
jgi:Xaa-Pro dipeptidase